MRVWLFPGKDETDIHMPDREEPVYYSKGDGKRHRRVIGVWIDFIGRRGIAFDVGEESHRGWDSRKGDGCYCYYSGLGLRVLR